MPGVRRAHRFFVQKRLPYFLYPINTVVCFFLEKAIFVLLFYGNFCRKALGESMSLSFIIMVVLARPSPCLEERKEGLYVERSYQHSFSQMQFSAYNNNNAFHTKTTVVISPHSHVSEKELPKYPQPKKGERMGLPSHPLHHSLSPLLCQH